MGRRRKQITLNVTQKLDGNFDPDKIVQAFAATVLETEHGPLGVGDQTESSPEAATGPEDDKPATPLADEPKEPLQANVEPQEPSAVIAYACVALAPSQKLKKTYVILADKTVTIGMSSTKVRKGKQIICYPDDQYLLELLRQRVLIEEVK